MYSITPERGTHYGPEDEVDDYTTCPLVRATEKTMLA
jgi:hypothetical protein